MRTAFLLLIFLFQKFSFSQSATESYFIHTKEADALFIKRNYKQAIQYYQIAFLGSIDLPEVIHRHRAAICWTLLDNADSAFGQLEKIAVKGKRKDYELVFFDSGFVALRKDARWKQMLLAVLRSKEGAMKLTYML